MTDSHSSESQDGGETTPHAGDRRGAALVMALFGIVVIALIISGAFFTSTQEFRGGRNQLIEQRAFAVAEFGLNSEVSTWDRSRNLPGQMAVGAIDSSRVYVAAGDTARVRITRLTPTSFWVVSEGRASINNQTLESKRVTNAYVRLAYPSIKPKGAITTAGNVNVTGSAKISGYSQDPSGWNQCAAIGKDSVPAIVAEPGATVNYKSQNIVSSPAVVFDPAAGDSNTYLRYGTESWNSLAANADISIAGGTLGSDIEPSGTSTVCNTADIYNWGDPYRPGTVASCQNYFPIVYSSGSLHLNGNGYGQGILLVNGDLKINGKFEWYGLVVVRDDIDKGNGTSMIMGAVYAANLQLADPTSYITGNQDIFYSKCAVESALRASAILVRVKERHWSQLQ